MANGRACAVEYRKRAREARRLAKKMTDADARQALFEAATVWERGADGLDERFKVLDADLSRIMGRLEIKDLPIEVVATLKLELSVLVHLWLDLPEQEWTPPPTQTRTLARPSSSLTVALLALLRWVGVHLWGRSR